MNRASPIDLRKAMEVAQRLTRVGIEFVCIPVMGDRDRAMLLTLLGERLDQMIQQADGDEKEAGHV